MTELVVAATLMVSTMAVVAPLTVRTGRLWLDIRHHQLAVETLSNELERLTGLTEEQRVMELASLAPPAHLVATLPSIKLSGETIRNDDGTQLRLSANWDRPGNTKSVSLIGWLTALPDIPDEDTEDSAISQVVQ